MLIRKKIQSIFSRLDLILKIDTAYFAKGSFWLAVGQSASVIASLIMVIFFANFIPKETYGTYRYVLSVVSILTISTLPGIGTTLSQAVAEGKEGSFIQALYVRIKYGMLGAIIAIGISIFYYIVSANNSVVGAFIIAAIFLPFMDPLGMFGLYLHSKKKFKQATLYFIASQAFVLISMMAATILTKNILVILFTYFGAWTITRGYCLWRIIKIFPPNATQSPESISYGLHISALGVIGQIASSIDSFLLFNFVGPVQVATYTVSTSPIEQMRSVFKNIPTVAVPKLTKRTVHEINAVLIKRILLLFAIGTLLSGVLIVIMPFLFNIIYHQYSDSARFAQWYAPTLALRLPLSFLTAVTQSKLTHFKKKWLYFGTIPNIVLIISLIIIVPIYGIMGIIVCRYINLFLSCGVGAIQWKLLTVQTNKQIT